MRIPPAKQARHARLACYGGRGIADGRTRVSHHVRLIKVCSRERRCCFLGISGDLLDTSLRADTTARRSKQDLFLCHPRLLNININIGERPHFTVET
jgi:hypothetical protein